MLKRINSEVKALNKKMTFVKPVDRWRVSWNEYLLDRRFFVAALAVLLILFSVVLFTTSGNTYVVWRCPVGGPWCENPFHADVYNFVGEKVLEGPCRIENPVLCDTPRIPPGTSLGVEPPWLMRNFGFVALLIVLTAFICNHIAYNLDWRMKS